jgi:protoheme IX farnesyltransferase
MNSIRKEKHKGEGLPYLEVTKPSSVLLLVFTAFGAMVVATDTYIPEIILLALTAIAVGSAAANTLTNYFDRDIDAVMARTRHRPLPMSRIVPAKNALYLGLALAVVSVVLALLVNLLTALFGLMGLVINVLVYNRWLKRRSPVNIIIGGFAGGAPVLAGYAAVTNTVTLDALLLAALVVLWIPTHIWSLALKYEQDYKVARIPMLPAVIGVQKAIRCIAATSVLLVIFSVLLYFQMGLGQIYLGVALVSGIIMLCLNIWLFVRSEERNAWIVFKFSSPYLALLFFALVVEKLVVL